MLRKLLTFTVVAVLICGLGFQSSFAQNSNVSDTKPSEPPQPVASENLQVRPNDKLKSDVGKLVADTKAGKVKLTNSAGQSVKKTGLSKGAKFAIVAGIAAAAIILTVIHVRNHMFDGFTPLGRGM